MMISNFNLSMLGPPRRYHLYDDKFKRKTNKKKKLEKNLKLNEMKTTNQKSKNK